jgi:hypothetical protein
MIDNLYLMIHTYKRFNLMKMCQAQPRVHGSVLSLVTHEFKSLVTYNFFVK